MKSLTDAQIIFLNQLAASHPSNLGGIIIDIWQHQDGRCRVTNIPMVCESWHMDAPVLDTDIKSAAELNEYIARYDTNGKRIHLICDWVSHLYPKFGDIEIRGMLSRYKAHRDKQFEHMAMQELLLDHFVTLLHRGGLSTTLHASNGLVVYQIENENEFYNRPRATLEKRGEIMVCGQKILLWNKILSHKLLDLSDPNYHIALLKFFGVEDYKFQIFADHDVFAHLQ